MLLGGEFDRARGVKLALVISRRWEYSIEFRSRVYCIDRNRNARKETMRRILEYVSLPGLALLFYLTWRAFHGPNPLPDRIPTHFDLSGNPDGWGSPSVLLVLPVIALVLYLVITLVARFPSVFNYPVRVTEENRARLEELALTMIAWLKVELVCLFTGLQWVIIAAVRNGRGRLSPSLGPVVLVVIFGTVGWYIVAMFRAARRGSS